MKDVGTRGQIMTIAEGCLYFYPKIENRIEYITKTINYLAFNVSFHCRAKEISDKIVSLIVKKVNLKNLKELLDRILSTWKLEDKIYFEYKYFKTKTSAEMSLFGVDTNSRGYFRKQNRLLKKYFQYLNDYGVDEEYLSINYGYLGVEHIRQVL